MEQSLASDVEHVGSSHILFSVPLNDFLINPLRLRHTFACRIAIKFAALNDASTGAGAKAKEV